MTDLNGQSAEGRGSARVPSYYNYESQPVAPQLSGGAGAAGYNTYGYDPSKLAPDSSSWGWGAQPQQAQATHVQGGMLSPQYAQYGYAGGNESQGLERPQTLGEAGRSQSEVGSVMEDYGGGRGGLRVANA